MRTQTFAAAAFWAATVTLVRAQDQTPLQFEAVSVKPAVNGIITGDGAARIGWFPGGLYRVDDGSVGVLLRSAYPEAVAIEGLTGWATAQHYDVQAKTSTDPKPADRAGILRMMLGERFGLVAHLEQRRHPTYALRVAHGDGTLGASIRRAPVDCTSFSRLSADAKAETPAPSNGGPRCGMRVNDTQMLSGGITMGILAGNLRGPAGRVVIDETDLAGEYEFTLNMSPDVSVFTAVREQLGLTLEPSEALLPVLVVDGIHPPTAN